jgi:hypothetical protein
MQTNGKLNDLEQTLHIYLYYHIKFDENADLMSKKENAVQSRQSISQCKDQVKSSDYVRDLSSSIPRNSFNNFSNAMDNYRLNHDSTHNQSQAFPSCSKPTTPPSHALSLKNELTKMNSTSSVQKHPTHIVLNSTRKSTLHLVPSLRPPQETRPVSNTIKNSNSESIDKRELSLNSSHHDEVVCLEQNGDTIEAMTFVEDMFTPNDDHQIEAVDEHHCNHGEEFELVGLSEFSFSVPHLNPYGDAYGHGCGLNTRIRTTENDSNSDSKMRITDLLNEESLSQSIAAQSTSQLSGKSYIPT